MVKNKTLPLILVCPNGARAGRALAIEFGYKYLSQQIPGYLDDIDSGVEFEG